MSSPERQSRTAELAQRLEVLRARSEKLPGAPVALEALQNERDLGGGLIAGGVAFRIFLWLVPFGLVVAAVFSFWTELDPDGLESAARNLGIGAAAAQAASEALELGDRNRLFVLLFGLVFLAWFTIGAVRALVLAYALAWQLKPPRIRRPFHAVAIFNGLFLLAILSSVAETWLKPSSATPRCSVSRSRSLSGSRSRWLRCGCYPTAQPIRASCSPAPCSSRSATSSCSSP